MNKNYYACEESLKFLEKAKKKFGEKAKIENNSLIFEKEILMEIINFFKNEGFEKLSSIICIDFINENKFCLVYELYNYELKFGVTLKTFVDRNNPVIDSVTSIFLNADWNEREIFDLFGVKFNNHPNLKRLLLKDDWVGHPLRKDDTSGDPPYQINWDIIEEQKYILNMKSINEKLKKYGGKSN